MMGDQVTVTGGASLSRQEGLGRYHQAVILCKHRSARPHEVVQMGCNAGGGEMA